MRLLALLLIAAAPVAAGCQTPTTPTTAAPSSPAEAPMAERVRAALADSGAVVLDVRTPAEWAGGYVQGARQLDVTDPGFDAGLAGLDKAKTYYVYCRSGNRSGRAIERMRAQGFTALVNAGGFSDLAAGGVPTAR